MAYIIGVDYGLKRTGIALSNEEETIAFPRGVFEGSEQSVIKKIAELAREKHALLVVIGLPRALRDQSDTEMTGIIRAFAERLKKEEITVEFEEEFLSTKEAGRAPQGIGIDVQAATIILQSYLERKKNMVQ